MLHIMKEEVPVQPYAIEKADSTMEEDAVDGGKIALGKGKAGLCIRQVDKAFRVQNLRWNAIA